MLLVLEWDRVQRSYYPYFHFTDISAEKAYSYKLITGPRRSFDIAVLFNSLNSLLVIWQKLLSDIRLELFLMINQ